MMQKLEKSEKTREEIEQKLMVQDAKLGMALVGPTCSLWKPCKLHSVPEVLVDNDLAQFELCYIKAQCHFLQHSSFCDFC